MAAKSDVNPSETGIDPATIPMPQAKADGSVNPADARGLNFTSEPGDAEGFNWGLQQDWVKAHDSSFESGKAPRKKNNVRRPAMILPAALLAVMVAAVLFAGAVGNKPFDSSEGRLPLLVEFCNIFPAMCSPDPDASSPPDNSSPAVPTMLGCWQECDPDHAACGSGLSCVPNYNNGGNGYVCAGVQCATPTPTTTPLAQEEPPASDPGNDNTQGVNVDMTDEPTTSGSKDGSGNEDGQTDASTVGGGSVPQPPTITATPSGVCADHGGVAYQGTTCVCPGLVDEVVICGDGTKTDHVTDQTCTPTESCVSPDGGGGDTGGQPPVCTCDFVCTRYGAAGCIEGGYVNSCTGATCRP